MGRKIKKAFELIHKRKNSTHEILNFKNIGLDSAYNNIYNNSLLTINENAKYKIYNNSGNNNKISNSENLNEVFKNKFSNKNLNKIEFNKNIVIEPEKETNTDPLRLMKKNTMIFSSFKKDFFLNSKEDISKSKLKSSLSLRRKKYFKEDPYFCNIDKIFEIKISKNFNPFDEFEDLNTNNINNSNFYEYTEDCFKILSKLDNNVLKEGYKSLSQIILDKNFEIKIKNSNKKLVFFDLNQTLMYYSINKVEEFEYQLSFEAFPENNEKIKFNIGVNIRPFLLEFLKDLSKSYIIGLFTSMEKEVAEKLIEFIDPNGDLFQIKLFRENCVKIKNPLFDNLAKNSIEENNSNEIKDKLNHAFNQDLSKMKKTSSQFLKEFLYFKDLRILENIPIEKILIIDNSILSFCSHLENGVLIMPFFQDKADSELRVLANYLNDLIQIQDIRIANKNVFKLDSFYKMLPCFQEYSSPSSIENFGYDSENPNNLSNFQFNKKYSSKNIINLNSIDNFDYSILSNNNNSKVNINNACNMTNITFNGCGATNLNNSLNSFGNELKIDNFCSSPISKGKEIPKHNDMSYQILFVKTTEEDLKENSNINSNLNKTLIINMNGINNTSGSYDSYESQSKNVFTRNNGSLPYYENNIKNKNEDEDKGALKSSSTFCEINKNKISKNEKGLNDSNMNSCNISYLNIFNSKNSNKSNYVCNANTGKLKIKNYEIVNINNLNYVNSEGREILTQSPSNIVNKSNFDTNFSFASSGNKGNCNNRSYVSNKSIISNNKNIFQEKLFICLEEFHSKYTNFFKNNKNEKWE